MILNTARDQRRGGRGSGSKGAEHHARPSGLLDSSGLDRPSPLPPEPVRDGDVGEVDANPGQPQREAPPPLRAVHTPNFPGLLRQLGASLLVTTYQAGKLVMVRDEGDHLNTHFRTFQAPMGLAFDGNRLAVGTTVQVWEFVDVPAVTAKLDPPGRHDACFLPRASHVTGNIQGHEMAWGIGRRALGGQHPVLLPLHARPLGQLHAAVAAAVRHARWSRPTAAT